jgi:D-amino peptidase
MNLSLRSIFAFLIVSILAGVPAGAAESPQAPAKPALKVFISVDMEGIWGVVAGEQTSSDSPEYARARKWMAQDANAAIEGAFAAGATEVVVNDSHGTMRNIDPDDLDPRASLVSGSPKPWQMMQGIDDTFDACVFIGYHARAGTTPAILDHTISGGTVFAYRVNGREMPELAINGALAGALKVPVVALSGDETTCRQAVTFLGDGLATAPVKEAAWRFAAKMAPRAAALERIREAVRKGVSGRTAIKPFLPAAPYAFELEFHQSNQAELAELIPGVRRPSARVVTFATGDYIEGFKLLRVLIALGSVR